MIFQISKRIEKTAQYYRDVDKTAQSLVTVIYALSTYLPPDSQMSFRDHVRVKLQEISASELAGKKLTTFGGRIGQAISLVKQFLNGQDENFINDTLDRVTKSL